MKQRMRNVFFRIFKNEYLMEIFATIGYGLLSVFYIIYRNVLRKKSNMTLHDARKILEETRPKPDMEYYIEERNMEQDLDLSIIVPAYNVATNIEKCIQSVISQRVDYKYELIIVNDGSTDNTEKTIKKIKDSRIRLINQENGGSSSARNHGINECRGKYIMFLDADDFLVGDCINTMMNEIIRNDADIIQSSYYSFMDGDEKNIQKTILKERVIENETRDMVGNPGFPWGKIYKRELFNEVRFPLNVWHQDTIVCMILYRMCKKIVVTDDLVYAYRINPNGVTKNARQSKKCIDHYWIMEYILNKAQELGLPNDEIQYDLVKSHMSTLLYRRVSLMEDKVVESAFILACDMLDKIRPQNYKIDKKYIQKDLERAFRTRNYKLWKLASFVV